MGVCGMQGETRELTVEQLPLSLLYGRWQEEHFEVLGVSSGLCREFGVAAAQVQRFWEQPLERVIHPDDVLRARTTVHEALAHTGQQQHVLCRVLKPGAEEQLQHIWLQCTLVAIKQETEELYLYIAHTDTTRERQQMEKNQRAAAAMDTQILDILNAIRPAVFWKDKQRRFLGANQAFLDYYGFPDTSVIIGKTDDDMGWHDDDAPFRNDELQVLETGRPTYRVLGHCQSHGEMRDIVASKSPIYDNQHNIVGLAGTFEDVTDERRQHERILELNQQLKKSLNLLEQANQADKAFFSNVSHDMRTPMNAIVGFTELATQAQDAEVKQAYLQKIANASKILLQLINDTLEISRLSNGKRQPEPVVVEPSTMFESLLTTIQENAAAKGVFFNTQLRFGEISAFKLDQVRLTKILMNLLSNAVKFTPAGKGVNLFGFIKERPDEQHCTLRFIVKDCGIGMSKDFLPRMYNAFEQERVTENGTGLGLSIVKGLVSLLHGTIACESELGKGTAFTVDLPVEIVPLPKTEHKEQVTAAPQVLQGAHILLCDDNALNQEIAVTLLSMQGLQVDTAADGKVGVHMFQASETYHYDAILMDIRMPVMDGLHAAQAIRNLPRADAPLVPIIALSANAFPEDVQKSQAFGMNDHLTKPLDIQKICQSLGQHITRYHEVQVDKV